MISVTKPDDFHSRFDIVGCFVEYDGKILLLHRQDNKPQGNTWGIPAGKADLSEDLLLAMQRELKEETGIDAEKIVYLDKVYTRYPEYDFIFHMYKTTMDQETPITINPLEHKAFIWVNPEEVNRLPLMEDIGECIQKYLR